MKKAAVYLKAHGGKVPGDIARVLNDGELWKVNLISDRIAELVDIPDGVDTDYLLATLVLAHADTWTKDGESDVLVQPMTVEKWTKDGESDVLVQPMTPEYWSKDGFTSVFIDPSDVSWTYNAPIVDTSWLHITSVFDNTWAFVPAALDHYVISEDTPTKVSDDKVKRIGDEAVVLSTGVYADMSTAFGVDKPEPATGWAFTAQRMFLNPSFYSTKSLQVIIATTTFTVGTALDTDQKCTDYSAEFLEAMDQYLVDRMLKYDIYLASKSAIEAE